MIQIKREKDASRINAILNHPEVRPWVAEMDRGVLDLTSAVENERNILLSGEYGACMFFKLLPGVYEVHTQTLPEGRGKWAKQFIEQALSWMFIRTDCYEVITRVPKAHAAARNMTLFVGARYEFTRENSDIFQGKRTDVEIYAIRIQDWIIRAEGLEERGAWFHERINAEVKRLGIEEHPHAEDVNHNRYVGAAVEMGLAGQVVKGVQLYNRWALVSRQPIVYFVSNDPPTIKFDVGYLVFHEGDIEVRREH